MIADIGCGRNECRSFCNPTSRRRLAPGRLSLPGATRSDKTMSTQPHNPLHGITLEQILELVAHFGSPSSASR